MRRMFFLYAARRHPRPSSPAHDKCQRTPPAFAFKLAQGSSPAMEVLPMLTHPRKMLAPTLSLGFLAAAFRFDAHHLEWFWADQPIVAIALACMAAGFGIAALFALHNARRQPPR
ncbi:hypothetical protein [Thermomonas sp.]|uniref:hypothetical protein n=1 Tax=Thermomonas sp. TaxID=1971895 RepID=UPI0026137205|nr:hypothetical protein [Thermomonas sp.]MCO5055179.1 hypothetical protein [Thermomonas sp.]